MGGDKRNRYQGGAGAARRNAVKAGEPRLMSVALVGREEAAPFGLPN